MIASLRKWIRGNPGLRSKLIPWWTRAQHLKWLARNIVTFGRPVSCPAGGSIIRFHPEGQIPEVLWLHDFELNDRNFVTAYLRPGMQVINIGANVGLYSVLASVLVGEKGRVHAFEPSLETFGRLLKNVTLNGCRNVTSVRLALSDAAGTLVLRADPNHPALDGHRFVEHIDRAAGLLQTDELVAAGTLDNYMVEQESQEIDFMIVDVEGAEFAVLRGAVSTLSRSDPTMLLECSRHQADTENLLRKLGYQFWVWDRAAQALAPTDFQQAARHGNIIVRREGWSARP